MKGYTLHYCKEHNKKISNMKGEVKLVKEGNVRINISLHVLKEMVLLPKDWIKEWT